MQTSDFTQDIFVTNNGPSSHIYNEIYWSHPECFNSSCTNIQMGTRKTRVCTTVQSISAIEQSYILLLKGGIIKPISMDQYGMYRGTK